MDKNTDIKTSKTNILLYSLLAVLTLLSLGSLVFWYLTYTELQKQSSSSVSSQSSSSISTSTASQQSKFSSSSTSSSKSLTVLVNNDSMTFCKNLEAKIKSLSGLQVGFSEEIKPTIIEDFKADALEYAKSSQNFDCDKQAFLDGNHLIARVLPTGTALNCYACDGNSNYISLYANLKENTDPSLEPDKVLSTKQITNKNNFEATYEERKSGFYDTNYELIKFKVGDVNFQLDTALNDIEGGKAKAKEDLMQIFESIS
jgi:hypothetical protein